MSNFTMVRSQSEPRVREPVWRPRTSLMSQKNILKITIRSKNLIVVQKKVEQKESPSSPQFSPTKIE